MEALSSIPAIRKCSSGRSNARFLFLGRNLLRKEERFIGIGVKGLFKLDHQIVAGVVGLPHFPTPFAETQFRPLP